MPGYFSKRCVHVESAGSEKDKKSKKGKNFLPFLLFLLFLLPVALTVSNVK
jgi:hypothetical protein